jgi:hypothetical protein
LNIFCDYEQANELQEEFPILGGGKKVPFNPRLFGRLADYNIDIKGKSIDPI